LEQEEKTTMQRIGWVIKVKPDRIEEYRRLHANVWPGILKMIGECHFTNYSIYLRELIPSEHYLFSYLEYTGEDFAADCARMTADEETQRWWGVCKPCQEPIETAKDGEWWADMEEVFHVD